MKIHYKIVLQLLLAILMQLTVGAQDFHVSQYQALPHYFNPARTGIYFGQPADYRIYSDYRTQWRSLGMRPYATYYLAYDMPYKEKYGFGGYMIHNRNGVGGLNTIQFAPSAAYKITDEKAGPHNLSVGAQLGIFYRGFDPNHFTYDSQYSSDSPTGFDPSLPSGENFEKTSLLKIDANMGVFYKYKKEAAKAAPWIGFSVYHITKPNQSFSGLIKDRMSMRVVGEIGIDYIVNEQLILFPSILYMNQAKAHELSLGTRCSYHIKDTQYDLMGGLNYRVKDAVVIQLGMKYDQHILTFSYDINTSYLGAYTHGRGAFEVSLLLSGQKGKPLFNPRFKGGKTVNKKL